MWLTHEMIDDHVDRGMSLFTWQAHGNMLNRNGIYIDLALNNSSMHGDGELIVQLRWRHRVHVNRFYISIAKMYSHACTFSRK